MKASTRAVAVIAAVAVVAVIGFGSLLGAQVFEPSRDYDALPCPTPALQGCGSFVCTAQVLPAQEGFDFKDCDSWSKAALRVLKSIESLQKKLDGYGEVKETACRRSVGDSISWGREVERVLRRMQGLVKTYRELDQEQRALMVGLTPSQHLAILEARQAKEREISAFLDHLSRRQVAFAADCKRRACEETQTVAVAPEPSAEEHGLHTLDTSDERWDGKMELFPGPLPEVEKETGVSSEQIERAARAMGLGIWEVVRTVMAATDGCDTSFLNMRGDAGQVELWQALGRGAIDGGAVSCKMTWTVPQPDLR